MGMDLFCKELIFVFDLAFYKLHSQNQTYPIDSHSFHLLFHRINFINSYNLHSKIQIS